MPCGKLILAIETSCDETSAAVVEGGRNVLSNVISSQVEIHGKFGGVVPEIASRKHLENITRVVKKAFDDAGRGFSDVDAVAVTYGPGLVGALLVGLSFAKAAAFALNVPLIGVNHIVGHIYAGFLEEPGIELPAISLVVSGGHTSVVYIEDHGKLAVLGETLDDAAGEVLDKVARAMGLGYPGGPKIEELAKSGDPEKYEFPRAWIGEKSLDFSYSGLKSSVINFLHNASQRGEELKLEDVAASFQEAVIDVLVEKTVLAVGLKKAETVVMAGGVAANGRLRHKMRERLEKMGARLVVPAPVLCTDNAAMIGCAAYYEMKRGGRSDMFLNAVPNLGLDVEKPQ